ncbi:hypothetical protein G5V59_00365 [Nocardioides sp. W3-2-3]|uniref:hypothetical protein n=1 Tax=Nocardioides convexus TaxID=2712224 RepID=UPI0024182E93|nr:hypothetical protein [Nocardioides convexus]NGZ99424.1 hypothetical protein [Nocardioides convexus]
MALTIEQANAVNTLVREVLGERRAEVSSADVAKAAALLADHAHKRLGAGVHSSTVYASPWAAREGVR